MSGIGTSGARAVVDLAEGFILATVEVAAPPERVFRALASEEVCEWWVRPGEFLEVDPPRRLVHTWHPVGAQGAPSTVTYLLEPIEGGTRLTLRHSGCVSRESAMANGLGWETSFERLAEILAASPVASPSGGPVEAYFCRLIPPRPSFARDMSEAEATLMREHAAYWHGWMEQGKVVTFGFVADPAGAYGIGIIEVADESEAEALTANDPTIDAARRGASPGHGLTGAARSSSSARSRSLRVSPAARSNSPRASSRRPSFIRKSPRTLGSRWYVASDPSATRASTISRPDAGPNAIA